MTEAARLGPYRILAPLGAGGMGTVSRAVHEDGHVAAVKTLGVVEPALLASLRREVAALQDLDHPGIVRILDHGVDDGRPWYAMALVEGGTLAERAEERLAPLDLGGARPRLPEARRDEVLAWLHALCAPLGHLHGRGLVHGDLKPDNVLFDPDGGLLLVDFGLVGQGQATGRAPLRFGGDLSGTLAYASPEALLGEVTDARHDLFALGCIAHELLTGRLPWWDPGAPFDPSRRLREPAPPASHWVDGVEPALDALVSGLLATSRRQRLGHADDVLRALEDLGVGADPDRVPPPAYLYRPEFIGRDALLEQLVDHLFDLEDGEGGLVALEGASGVGKTRLAAELATVAVGRRLRVLSAECSGGGVAEGRRTVGEPLVAFRPLLQAAVDEARTGGPEVDERLFGDRGPVLAPYLPAIATLPGQAGRPPLAPVGPQAARERLGAAVLGLLRELAREDPLLLLVDDLQWADPVSLEVLGRWSAEDDAEAAVLVVATVRREELDDAVDAILEGGRVTRVAVGRLEDEPVTQLVGDMLGVPTPPETLTRYVLDRAEGNPFFATEYLRTALDEGLLHRDGRGRWHLDPDRGAPEVLGAQLAAPTGLQALVRRRLSLLDAAAREAAGTASVLGLALDEDRLLRALGGDPGDGRRAVQSLVRRQVLEPAPEGGLRFTHGQVRELTYGLLDPDDRRRRHRACATVLDAEGPRIDDVGAQATLAGHWRDAGEGARAAIHFQRAGGAAIAAAAYPTAATLLREALQVEPSASAETLGRRHARLAEALFGTATFDAVDRHGRAALDHLDTALPTTDGGWTLAFAAEAARAALGWTGPTAPAGEDRLPLAARTLHQLFYVFYFNEAVLPMLTVCLRAVRLSARTPDDVDTARLKAQLGYVLGVARLDGAARRTFDEASTEATTRGDPGAQAAVRYHEALVHISFARWAEAERTGREAIGWAQQTADATDRGNAATMVLHVELYTGRLADSLRRCRALSAQAAPLGHRQHEAWGWYAGARVHLARGAVEAAIEDLRRAEALLETLMDSASTLITRGLLAQALVRAGRLAEGASVLQAGMATLDAGVSSVFSTQDGFAALVEAGHGLARAGHDAPASAAAARRASRALQQLSWAYPVAGPASLLARAHVADLAGRTRRRERLVDRALQAAERLGMPYATAAAHDALLRFGSDRPGLAEAHQRAHDRLDPTP